MNELRKELRPEYQAIVDNTLRTSGLLGRHVTAIVQDVAIASQSLADSKEPVGMSAVSNDFVGPAPLPHKHWSDWVEHVGRTRVIQGVKISDRAYLQPSKEPVLLTDAELLPMLRRAFGWSDSTTWETIAEEWKPGVRAIEAACHAKQKQVTRDVIVRIYRDLDGDLKALIDDSFTSEKRWTLLKTITETVELK